MTPLPAPQERQTIAHGVSRVVSGIYRESPKAGRKRPVFTPTIPNLRLGLLSPARMDSRGAGPTTYPQIRVDSLYIRKMPTFMAGTLRASERELI
jgi:hypothetical protein